MSGKVQRPLGLFIRVIEKLRGIAGGVFVKR